MSRIRHFWNVHFLGVEFAISVIISVIFTIWVVWFRGSTEVDSILNGNRSAVYGALASIFGSLLGFVITALSVIIGYSTNEKFEFLRKSKHYPTLWKVLLQTIKALSVATIFMIVGLVFDRDNSPHDIILCFCVFAILLSFFRLKRYIWVLENVIYIIIK